MAWSSGTMKPENDVLVPIRKGSIDIIYEFISNAFAMVIVKYDRGEWMRWSVPCEDVANFLPYSGNISATEEGC
jgi:hypothetical protein